VAAWSDIRVIPASDDEEETPVQDHELHCAICQADMIFEIPPTDDLGDDSPELVCTGCGTAIISAPLTGRVWWRPKGTKIAPQQRRAA
jgi:hypothetical protein